MTNYILMHKDIMVTTFIYDFENDKVVKWFIPKSSEAQKHMPLDLKIVIHYKLWNTENKNSYTITEEDYTARLDCWLSDRAIPVHRDNIEKYSKNKNTVAFMLKYNALSLTDCYWIKEVGDTRKWNDVKLYNSNRIDSYSIISKNRDTGWTYSGVNATLGGQLEKFWYYSKSKDGKKQLMLSKRNAPLCDILSIREIIASKIYEKQGFKNYCHYYLTRNRNGDIIGCKCKAFTDEKHELISAYELLREHNEDQSDNVYEILIARAAEYGANPDKVRKQLELEIIVDYLITNRDRHESNIAFLRNSDTLKIIGMAPIFDSGSSESMEKLRPYGVIGTSINSIFKCEDEALAVVRNVNILDFSKLPEDRWIKEKLGINSLNTDSWKLTIYQLYKAKIEYLRHG